MKTHILCCGPLTSRGRSSSTALAFGKGLKDDNEACIAYDCRSNINDQYYNSELSGLGFKYSISSWAEESTEKLPHAIRKRLRAYTENEAIGPTPHGKYSTSKTPLRFNNSGKHYYLAKEGLGLLVKNGYENDIVCKIRSDQNFDFDILSSDLKKLKHYFEEGGIAILYMPKVFNDKAIFSRIPDFLVASKVSVMNKLYNSLYTKAQKRHSCLCPHLDLLFSIYYMNGNTDGYHRYLESNAIYSNIIIQKLESLKLLRPLSEELYNSFIWRGIPIETSLSNVPVSFR